MSADKQVTKRDQLIKLLLSKGVATVAQLEEKHDWQSHTVRAAISRLRKTGHDIERKNAEGKVGSAYRLIADDMKRRANQVGSQIAADETSAV